MNCDLRDIYDQFATNYDQSRGLFDMTDVLNSFIRRIAVEKGKLLDLGCGAGEPFARFFVDRGWTVTGVDFSRRMLAMAARYVPEMQTICADMSRIDFPPASFQAISAIYSLFHLPVDEQTALFGKIYKWLGPRGKLLFTYATKEYTGADEFAGFKEFMGQKLYYSHKKPEELHNDLRKIGFQVEAEDYRRIGGETFLWVAAGLPAQ